MRISKSGKFFKVVVGIKDVNYYDFKSFIAKMVEFNNEFKIVKFILKDGRSMEIFNLDKISQISITETNEEETE